MPDNIELEIVPGSITILKDHKLDLALPMGRLSAHDMNRHGIYGLKAQACPKPERGLEPEYPVVPTAEVILDTGANLPWSSDGQNKFQETLDGLGEKLTDVQRVKITPFHVRAFRGDTNLPLGSEGLKEYFYCRMTEVIGEEFKASG